MRLRLLPVLLLLAACASEDSGSPCPRYMRMEDGACLPDEPLGPDKEPAHNWQVAYPQQPMPERPNPATPEKIALGRLLFFDPVLSGDDAQSCATCHHPNFGFSDSRIVSMGAGGAGLGPERNGGLSTRRHAPGLWNIAYSPKQFWDGRAATLEEQAEAPLTSEVEMASTPEEIEADLLGIPEYVARFQAAFPNEESPVTFSNVTFALAAFERTLLSFDAPFDRYVAGDDSAMSAAQLRGWELFSNNEVACIKCHIPPTFEGGRESGATFTSPFRVIGVPLREDEEEDIGRYEFSPHAPNLHAFKIPTLRNVASNPPYMHNGSIATLEEVIDFYSRGAGESLPVKPANLDSWINKLKLSEEEQADLRAFLDALVDVSAMPEIPESVPSGLPVTGL